MEFILHLTGLCTDRHSHIDLLDAILGGGSIGLGVVYIKYYYKTIIFIVKDYFKTKDNPQ